MDRINSKRSTKPILQQGTIVFLKNYSIPKNGRARKFRPYYLRSPQIVLTASSTSAVTLRLANSFISRHHPDDILEYKGNEKDPKLYESLPKEVLAFMGKPMEQSTIKELAKHDKLDIIYTDHSNILAEKVITRQDTAKQKELDKAMDIIQLNAENDNWRDEDENELRAIPPKSSWNYPIMENNLPTIPE